MQTVVAAAYRGREAAKRTFEYMGNEGTHSFKTVHSPNSAKTSKAIEDNVMNLCLQVQHESDLL